jgi:hypothetical protein
VTWEWGAGQGSRLALLYGGVYGPDQDAAPDGGGIRSPFFLALIDSLGVRQVLRFEQIHYQGARPLRGRGSPTSPHHFDLIATREQDTVRLAVAVSDALGSDMKTRGFHRTFLQMRGSFTITGRVVGQSVSDSGAGFFETYAAPR